LELKQPAGIAAVLTLIERSNVLIEGYRPEMERLGWTPALRPSAWQVTSVSSMDV
jgi:crotonobetainyl-CoA:carnitine CoA-transferase CaiB-like acyl-CoA transferase